MRRSALSVGCVALGVLAGCGTSTAGTPVARHLPSTVDSTTTSETPDYSLARLCELLAPEEARRMGGSATGEEGGSIRDGHALCMWADEMDLLVGVQPGVTANSGQPGQTNTPITVDGMPAILAKQTKPVVLCQVLVNLPDGNLLGAGAGPLSRGEGKYDSCVVAKEMAELIVPRVKDK